MIQALQIMFVAVVITAVTGFLISLLIQVLSSAVGVRRAAVSDDSEKIALAVALAIRQRDGE